MATSLNENVFFTFIKAANLDVYMLKENSIVGNMKEDAGRRDLYLEELMTRPLFQIYSCI